MGRSRKDGKFDRYTNEFIDHQIDTRMFHLAIDQEVFCATRLVDSDSVLDEDIIFPADGTGCRAMECEGNSQLNAMVEHNFRGHRLVDGMNRHIYANLVGENREFYVSRAGKYYRSTEQYTLRRVSL